MQRFTDLRVWQEAHGLATAVYRLVSGLPVDERFGLSSQLRRAAVSVPSNIAEGSKRRSNREYAHFLNIAEGSLAETEELLMLARDVGLVAENQARALLGDADRLARGLATLRSRVERASTSSSSPSTLDPRPSTPGAER